MGYSGDIDSPVTWIAKSAPLIGETILSQSYSWTPSAKSPSVPALAPVGITGMVTWDSYFCWTLWIDGNIVSNSSVSMHPDTFDIRLSVKYLSSPLKADDIDVRLIPTNSENSFLLCTLPIESAF